MERIIAAAYLVKPEFIKEGTVYKKGTKESDDIYRCRIGRHHAEILHLWGKQIDHATDGFYTSYGRYVDRKEAAKIALNCGQIKRLHYWQDQLDSSDVFDYDEIDTLEVKEVELDEETLHSELRKIYASIYDTKDIKSAKRFFELGLKKGQKGE